MSAFFVRKLKNLNKKEELFNKEYKALCSCTHAHALLTTNWQLLDILQGEKSVRVTVMCFNVLTLACNTVVTQCSNHIHSHLIM